MRKGENIRDEISFNGVDGLKSPEFIQAIRNKSFSDDKANDSLYMVNLVSLCLSGPALEWFEHLGDEVQNDWSLLRRALLARFPAPGSEKEGDFSRSLTFAGGSPEECQDFVTSVRKHSHAEGRSDDDKWTAHYAASCMAREALKWHANLDMQVRSSWIQLERALLAYFPEPPPYGLALSCGSRTEGLWSNEEKWLQEARERRATFDKAPPGVYPVDGGTYVIRCKATNTVLDNGDFSTAVGNQIIGFETNGGANQKWKLILKPGTDQYSFVNLHNGMALGCTAAITRSAPCTLQHTPTYFQVVPLGYGLYKFCVPLTNYGLDISGASAKNGAKVILYPSHGGPNQQFYLDRY